MEVIKNTRMGIFPIKTYVQPIVPSIAFRVELLSPEILKGDFSHIEISVFIPQLRIRYVVHVVLIFKIFLIVNLNGFGVNLVRI